MAGDAFRVGSDDTEVRAAFDRLKRAGIAPRPAMQELGEHLIDTARERFSDQEAPDGAP